MIRPVIIVTLSLLHIHQMKPLAPSGGMEGPRWFDQVSSAVNPPQKSGFQNPGFQNPGVNQPFEPQPQPKPQPETQNAAQPQNPGFQQPVQNQGTPFRQPSLFELLFGPAFSSPSFASQPQGVQNQPQDVKCQQTPGFEAPPSGMDAASGAGFQNTGFQNQQAQQPQTQNQGFQNAGFGQQSPGSQQNAGFQGQQPDPGFQAQGKPGFQQAGVNGQPQPGFEGQQNPPFTDPIQSEMSIFNNLLRNFFMW